MNTIESPSAQAEPEQSEPEHQSTLLRWLGKIRWNFKREDTESVTYQEDESGVVPSENGDSSEPKAIKTADEIVDEAVERHHEATKNEAGRPEGRILPELVIGPQRYPDPSHYDPEGVTQSLTVDEEYGETVSFILDVAREAGLARSDPSS